MAYFRKRGKTWTYQIDLGTGPTGKRIIKSKGGFTTKKLAQLAASEMEKELFHGTYVEETNISFEAFANQWLNIYSETSKISTIRPRKTQINHLLYYFKNYKLKDITKIMYQNMLIDLKKREYSENTIIGVHACGRMIFNKAIEFNLIKINPSKHAKLPKEQKSVEDIEGTEEKTKYLEKEELVHFLEQAKTRGIENETIFTTLAYTGMRVGELCALKWKDIDFCNQTISITKTYYNEKNRTKEYKLVPPKNGESRVIDVDSDVLDLLKKYRMKQNELKMIYRKNYYDHDFVFARGTQKYAGYPHVIKTIEDRMRTILKKAGFKFMLSPHSLRHTHTSLLAEAGVGLQEIMERLGHKNDKMTREVYLHVTKEMKKQASQKFSELMKSLK